MLWEKILGAASKAPISLIGAVSGSTLVSGVTSVTFTGQQIGDVLIAMGAGQSSTKPSFTSGWTEIVNSSGAGARSLVAVYKVADTTSSTTVTFTSSGSSSAVYSSGLIVRNSTGFGATNFILTDGTSGLSQAVPTLSLTNTTGSSMVVTSSIAEVVKSISGSPAMSLFKASPAMGGYLLSATSFSASRTFSFNANTGKTSVSFEVLG